MARDGDRHGREWAKLSADRLIAKLNRQIDNLKGNIAELQTQLRAAASPEVRTRLLAAAPALAAAVKGEPCPLKHRLQRNVALHADAREVNFLAPDMRALRSAQKGPRLEARAHKSARKGAPVASPLLAQIFSQGQPPPPPEKPPFLTSADDVRDAESAAFPGQTWDCSVLEAHVLHRQAAQRERPCQKESTKRSSKTTLGDSATSLREVLSAPLRYPPFGPILLSAERWSLIPVEVQRYIVIEVPKLQETQIPTLPDIEGDALHDGAALLDSSSAGDSSTDYYNDNDDDHQAGRDDRPPCSTSLGGAQATAQQPAMDRPFCGEGHQMVSLHVGADGEYVCDACQSLVPSGQFIVDCRECDNSFCAPCLAERKQQAAAQGLDDSYVAFLCGWEYRRLKEEQKGCESDDTPLASVGPPPYGPDVYAEPVHDQKPIIFKPVPAEVLAANAQAVTRQDVHTIQDLEKICEPTLVFEPLPEHEPPPERIEQEEDTSGDSPLGGPDVDSAVPVSEHKPIIHKPIPADVLAANAQAFIRQDIHATQELEVVHLPAAPSQPSRPRQKPTGGMSLNCFLAASKW